MCSCNRGGIAGLAALILLAASADGQVRAGADLSTLPRLEALGAQYFDDGAPADVLDMLSAKDYEIVRLRLWHSPSESWSGADSVVAFSQRCHTAGFELLLDLHYSDSWADPMHQTKPAAWQGLPFALLVDSVYVYTNAVIRRFRDAGALPSYVQIGNEITNGLLWDDGRVGGSYDTPQQWGQLGQLLNAGIAAVRDSLPPDQQPKTIFHIDRGGDNGGCRWFFDHVLAQGVSFDAIGLSYYPWWHGSLDQLESNLQDLAPRYGKEILIVETAYPWTLDWSDTTNNMVGEADQLLPGYMATESGQSEFLHDLLTVAQGTPDLRCTSVIYWEPAWIPVSGFGTPWENLALFDFNGNALPALSFSLSVPMRARELASRLSIVAWPNPFNVTTTLAITLAHPGIVSLNVYDVCGRRVSELIHTRLTAGVQTISFDGTSLPSGSYFARLNAGTFQQTTKLVILK